jgi:hydroxymethylglutaryl-CoA reductase (NADPH)
MILRRLYTNGSLRNVGNGVAFEVKNRLSDATLTRIAEVKINEHTIPLDELMVDIGNGEEISASQLGNGDPMNFPLRMRIGMRAPGTELRDGKHQIKLAFETKPFGRLSFKVTDALSDGTTQPIRAKKKDDAPRIPYDKDYDHNPKMIAKRRKFIEEFSGAKLEHTSRYSFDPELTQGNIESFTGVAQVPLGFAGPLTIHGEHAEGEFIVPLATSEGTLVASYNRGMKVLNLSGGAHCTVLEDRMQRAPVFIFDRARDAREFKHWVDRHFADIRAVAEDTSSVARLLEIDSFLANHFCFMRFNFSTGDAAGQNMVGRATLAACDWILENTKTVRKFYLESNLAGDKKGTQLNIMRTRGKRVVAEATIKREVLLEEMRADTESLFFHYNVANIGAFLSGSNNNGCHSPNALTAMFIATGQDVANVAESSAGVVYAELTPEKDLHLSLTIPSLIVATHGGGTALPTQREALEVLGCTGPGKVNKFAEIVVGVALAGEVSLAASISALEWVSSHERFGRNR